jgi:hypothetical protein
MALSRRTKLILGAVAVVGVMAGWQGIRYWWFHGYSIGERTGVIRKISVKGTPICKYMEGEMSLASATPGQQQEIWQFSIDDHSDANPVMKQLRDAERDGSRVTLHYRQDLKSWWRCTPEEYFVTSVELAPTRPADPAAPPAPTAPAK